MMCGVWCDVLQCVKLLGCRSVQGSHQRPRHQAAAAVARTWRHAHHYAGRLVPRAHGHVPLLLPSAETWQVDSINEIWGFVTMALGGATTWPFLFAWFWSRCVHAAHHPTHLEKIQRLRVLCGNRGWVCCGHVPVLLCGRLGRVQCICLLVGLFHRRVHHRQCGGVVCCFM